jgi:hypothetical protein
LLTLAGGTYILLDLTTNHPIDRLTHKLLYSPLPSDFFVLVCKKTYVRPKCVACGSPSFMKIGTGGQRLLLKKSSRQPKVMSMMEFWSYGLSYLFHA